MTYSLPFLLTAAAILAPRPACAFEAPASAALKAAKETYRVEAGKITTAINEAIEKRLLVAQKSRKPEAVELVLAEKKAFQEYGDIPPSTPVGQRNRLAELAKVLDSAYAEEIRNLTQDMKPDQAAALDKELTEFRERIALQTTRITLLGTWKLELGNYTSNFTFFPDGTMFHSRENYRGTWTVDMAARRIIVAPPQGKSADRINLPLDPQGTRGQSSSGGTFTLTKIR